MLNQSLILPCWSLGPTLLKVCRTLLLTFWVFKVSAAADLRHCWNSRNSDQAKRSTSTSDAIVPERKRCLCLCRRLLHQPRRCPLPPLPPSHTRSLARSLALSLSLSLSVSPPLSLSTLTLPMTGQHWWGLPRDTNARRRLCIHLAICNISCTVGL